MTFGIRTANDGTYAAITSGTEDVARFGGRNGDNSGQLAGFRNILLNPRVSNGINQRNVANWAAVAVGAYGYDRWKKVDASTITQIVEAGNYIPNAVYTLSGDNVVTGQVTAPASGNWTLPNILNTADNVQLEKGYIATDRENKLGLEFWLNQRYYCRTIGQYTGQCITPTTAIITVGFPNRMRVSPTLKLAVSLGNLTNSTAGVLPISSMGSPSPTTVGAYYQALVASVLTAGNATIHLGSDVPWDAEI